MDALSMFSIVLCLVIFVIFFILGYLSEKRSGGFFLMLAGFVLINVAVTAYSVLGAVVSIIVVIGIFIVFQGGMKAFYARTAQNETGGGNRSHS